MDRPTAVEIDLGALRHNLSRIQEALKGEAEILAMVKADAYGHGAGPIARTLEAGGVSLLGVATAEEGIELREAGAALPILILGGIYPGEHGKYSRHGLTPVLFDADTARELREAARKEGRTRAVHLKIDTGMNRLGFPWKDWEAYLSFFREARALEIEGLMSHFAVAESERPEDRAFTEEQMRRFQICVEQTRRAGIRPRFLHQANSSAVIGWGKARFNLVRPGLLLYGVAPTPALSAKIPLKPILTWKTRILALKEVSAGESVSYGRTFVCGKDSLIATLPIGYADGYPRRFSNRAEVLVRGRRAKVAGVVCMDLTMAEVSHIPGVQIGDEVVLLGKQGSAEIHVRELAGWGETIPYEIFCGIGKRVPRLYVDGARNEGMPA
jgi:alanine racemase